MTVKPGTNERCMGCVYYPPNLPESAYPKEDYQVLQGKRCCFYYQPKDDGCKVTRKTSCSLVDLAHLTQSI